MKRIIIIILTLISVSGIYAQSGSYAGSFARLGFGARGLAKGNAMVSDIYGDYSGYYNPAISCFQEDANLNLGYTLMSLDRKLNFIGIAKKITMEQGSAGISLSWINAGVTDIDGRDNDANKIGDFSTFENQFYLGTGFLLDEKLALGIGFKLYYTKLFDEVTTNSIAFDIGAIYKAMPELTFGATIRDISAKYKWETNAIYGSNGKTTTDKFPILFNLGASYLLPKNFGIVSLEFETMFVPEPEVTLTSNSEYKKRYYYVKAGTEIKLTEQLKIRAGLDRIGLNEEDFSGSLKPGIGVGFKKVFTKNIMLGIDYSFQLEPYTKQPFHNLGINFNLK
ncbi:MAG: PorV/PorQ family protein [Ignavibacteria bacterium]|nr:PorV/PorQ family protein [Ignavibacteria bacterium]